jgi:2-polyprenyl-6-methoxyphenol hydroxylase-like FAD-dependent oxidoreductase
MKRQRILIVGAGIAGLALARRLMNSHEVDIVERAEQLHTSGTGIMLGINAMQVLQRMGKGLAQQVRSQGRELGGFAIADHRGRPLSTLGFSQEIRAQGLGLYGIHRNRLHELLYEGLAPRIRFATQVYNMHEDNNFVHVDFSDGSNRFYDLVIGADGIYSRTRIRLAPQLQLRYAGYTCWRFMVGSDPKDKAVEMWGRGRRLGIVPLSGDQTYVFMVANAPANQENLESFNAQRMAREFGYFGDIAPAVLERLADASVMVHNDLYDLPTPVLGSRRILLAGDAAHATTPNMGQGAGMAIEDAWVLSQIIDQANGIDEIINLYDQRRRQRVQQVVKMSYNLGRIAQWESPTSTWLRNRLLALLPDSLNARHMERLLLSY